MKFCIDCNDNICLNKFPKSHRTGKPVGNICKVCTSKRTKERQKNRKNCPKFKDWLRKYKEKEETKEKVRGYAKKYRSLYPEKYKKISKIFREKNKEYLKQKNKAWRNENAAKIRMSNKIRSKILEKATIIKTKDIFKQMSEFYKACRILEYHFNEKYHVDHIIPLKNKNVCGLNVPWNLTIAPKRHNIIKKNKFDGTYNNESWRQDL